MKRYTTIKIAILTAVVGIIISSCNKSMEFGKDPYAGGKESLGVGFFINYPEPDLAKPGELVDFYVKGLKDKLDKISFFINDTPVEIITAKDSLVTIKVPEHISSGDAKIIVDNEVFYGPRLEIEGNTSLDENYGMVNGFRGGVYDILPNAGGYIVAGAFSNFENEAVDKKVYINGVHFIDGNGKSNRNSMTFGEGATGGGYIRSIAKTTDGKFLLAGGLSKFDKRSVGNIVRVNSNGRIDSMIVDVINTSTEPQNSLDTVSAFNGFTNGPIMRTFVTGDNKVIAVGNFTSHYKIDYAYSSRDNRKYIVSTVRNVIRMRADGSLDSAFALNNIGANGQILDAVMTDNGRIIIVGLFSSYNGKPAKGIACIRPDGSVDESFKLNANITRLHAITYNKSKNRLAISGTFSGAGSKGNISNVVLMDEDGVIDENFVLGDVGFGIIGFAHVLNNGRVLVDGSQKSYDKIPRPNLLILESNGTLVQKYNAQAPFSGSIHKVIETTSSLGEPALLIGGEINQFGTKSVGNFFRMEIKD